MINEEISLVIAAVLMVSVVCQWAAWRVKLPAIIFLLLIGIAAGPLTGRLDPDALLGDLLFPLVSLSVAVILFEGSLTLKFDQVQGLMRVIRNMITFGMAVTWIITAAATRLALGFSWEVCLLFGALMTVTGPTVIVPMLRAVRPTAAVANILRWEGILIDPVGATLAVLVFEFIVAGQGGSGFSTSIGVFGKILLIGFSMGAAAAQSFGVILRRHWLPIYLHNVMALSLVTGVFALSNHLEAESGLLTVTVMGIWLANMKGVDLDEILDFKESLSILLISVLFVLLAARIDLAAFTRLGWPAVAVFASIQFLARPLNVQISALGSDLSRAERHLLAWIAPRGIVAAAVSALFALKLEPLGYADARFLVPLTFMVIIGTVLLQSATARPIARWLGVAEPEPKGVLVVGANPVAVAVGQELVENGFRVLLADDNWRHIAEAKMAGLPTYYGNPASEHAERHLDLVGIGRVLALTPRADLNALVMQHYRMEFGPGQVFRLRTSASGRGGDAKTTLRRDGRPLFGQEVTFASLASMLAGGAELKTTTLTENFSFTDYLSGPQRRLPLFAIDPADRLHVFAVGAALSPAAGWKVIGLTGGL